MTGKSNTFRAVTLAALMVLSVVVGSIAFAGGAAAAATSLTAQSAQDVAAGDSAASQDVVFDVTIENGTSDTITINASELRNAGASITGASAASSNTSQVTVDSTTVNANGDVEVSLSDASGAGVNGSATITVTNTVDASGVSESSTVTYALSDSAASLSSSASFDLKAYSADATLADGTFWQGQELRVSNLAADTTYQIRTYDGGSAELVREFTTDSLGNAILKTGSLDGEYTITNTSGGIVAPGGDGSFEIAVQDLSATFAEGSVTEDGTVGYTIDTNRGKSTVEISASGLSADKLASIFGSLGSVTKGDGFITVSGVTSGTYTADFSGVATGSYDVTVDVTDTSAQSTDSINVTPKGDVTASFAADLAQVPQGDIAWFTVNLENTDTASLTIGSEDVNYLANVTVVDNDGDGKVTVGFNSYTAGTENATVVTAKGDSDSATLDDQTTGIDLLDTGSYDMSIVAGANQHGAEAQDLATLSIQPRQTIGHTVYTAPSGSDIDAVVSDGTLTERSDITTADWQVHHVEATGIFGLLASKDNGNATANLAAALNASELTFTAEQQNPGQNKKALKLDAEKAINDGALHVVSDRDNNSLYLVVKPGAQVYTRDGGSSYESASTGNSFNATFSVDAASGLAGEDGESVYADYNIVEPSSSLNVNDDGMVVVNPGEGQAISGSTNLAPGTSFSLRVQSKSSDAPFIKTAGKLTVQADGTFSGSFDFSDVPADTEFSVSARTGGTSVATADGIVQEKKTTTTTTTTTTTSDDTTTTTTTTTSDDTTTTTTDEPTTEQTTEGETPGFGVIVGLIAMLGAALLALRREN